jgi:UDP-4-amino-4,6-dideoxy-N-acetyl-beta-L-altrosamine transaminase
MNPSTHIPYGRQSISDADIESVTSALRSEFLTQGAGLQAFERGVADISGASYAVATNSATSALHIACLALGLQPGDTLWTSPISFVASANCALYCGASVGFVDVNPVTRNLCPIDLETKLRDAETNGGLPKIVVPVHLSGLPCDMRAIHALSLRYGFKIIEDASHAIGATLYGAPIGDCSYSDITVFSFHPVKIITTGEGGIAVTNNADMAERMRLLRSHGIVREEGQMISVDGPWYYEQQELGYNYRMTDLQAALGSSQLKKLKEFVEQRDRLARRYDNLLADFPCELPARLPSCQSAWHLYIIEWDEQRSDCTRLELFRALRAEGIGVNVHYIPIYRQPYYTKMGFRREDYPNSERYYSRAITLPLFPSLNAKDQDRVISIIRSRINK